MAQGPYSCQASSVVILQGGDRQWKGAGVHWSHVNPRTTWDLQLPCFVPGLISPWSSVVGEKEGKVDRNHVPQKQSWSERVPSKSAAAAETWCCHILNLCTHHADYIGRTADMCARTTVNSTSTFCLLHSWLRYQQWENDCAAFWHSQEIQDHFVVFQHLFSLFRCESWLSCVMYSFCFARCPSDN